MKARPSGGAIGGRSWGPERGSAVVETALVTVVLTGLFLAVFQLGLGIYVRTTLIACAADGARYGANADRTPEEGAEHTRELIRAALPDWYADDVAPTVVSADGRDIVEVTVTAPLPVVGMFAGPRRGLIVHGHAIQEGASASPPVVGAAP